MCLTKFFFCQLNRGPTKHRKELQGTTRNYKVLLNLQNAWKHYKELQGTFIAATR